MAGYRAGTRHKFRKAFRRHGETRMNNYLKTLRIGEYADIIVDGAIHKGMPHQFYHGRTGRIFSVNKRSVGVHMLKAVKGRYFDKWLNVRVEHVRPSNTRSSFVKRIQESDRLKTEANKKGQRISTKRTIAGPRPESTVTVDPTKVVFRTNKPFIELH